MAAPRVTLLINGKRHAMKRIRTHSNDTRFARVFRAPNVPEPWPYVHAELQAVHTYKCRTGRWNSRTHTYDECTCGARDMLKALVTPRTRARRRA